MMKIIGQLLLLCVCFEFILSPLANGLSGMNYGVVYADDDTDGQDEAACKKRTNYTWDATQNRCVMTSNALAAMKGANKCETAADPAKCAADTASTATTIDMASLQMTENILNTFIVIFLAGGVASQMAIGNFQCSSSYLLMMGGAFVMATGEIIALVGYSNSVEKIKKGFNISVAPENATASSTLSHDAQGYSMANIQSRAYESLAQIQEAYRDMLKIKQVTSYIGAGIMAASAVMALAELIEMAQKDNLEMAETFTENLNEDGTRQSTTASTGRAKSKIADFLCQPFGENKKVVASAAGGVVLTAFMVATGMNAFMTKPDANKISKFDPRDLRDIDYMVYKSNLYNRTKVSSNNIGRSKDAASAYLNWKEFIKSSDPNQIKSQSIDDYDKLVAGGLLKDQTNLSSYIHSMAEQLRVRSTFWDNKI